MNDSVSFKAFLKRDGQQIEVRRFGIDDGVANSYLYLKSKINAIFPSIQNEQYSIFWQDTEGDYITVSSDEEMVVALSSSSTQPIKLFIHVKSDQEHGSSSQEKHPLVICDSCEGNVVGFRYKCITCPDFDLCSTCEASGNHPEHLMLRIPTPLRPSCSSNKFFRKMFNRPYKFHKRHGHFAPDEKQGNNCPFVHQQDSGPTSGKLPMFDLNTLLEFLNNLGVGNMAGDRGATSNAWTSSQTQDSSSQAQATRSQAQASSSQAQATRSQTQASSSQARASSSQTQAGKPTSHQGSQPSSSKDRNAPEQQYLNGIGQTIAAFLDPFGIDVTFDVRSKTAGTPEVSAQSPQKENSPPPPANEASGVPSPSSSIQQEPEAPSPSSSIQQEPEAPSSRPISEIFQPNPAPVVSPSQPEIFREASTSPTTGRRNSDDWTILSRESPVCNVESMDVDELRGAKPKTVYPELPKDTSSFPTAPPQHDFADPERYRIQDAVHKINSMGFNFDTGVLMDLLRRENCDIASVLEVILGNVSKK